PERKERIDGRVSHRFSPKDETPDTPPRCQVLDPLRGLFCGAVRLIGSGPRSDRGAAPPCGGPYSGDPFSLRSIPCTMKRKRGVAATWCKNDPESSWKPPGN